MGRLNPRVIIKVFPIHRAQIARPSLLVQYWTLLAMITPVTTPTTWMTGLRTTKSTSRAYTLRHKSKKSVSINVWSIVLHKRLSDTLGSVLEARAPRNAAFPEGARFVCACHIYIRFSHHRPLITGMSAWVKEYVVTRGIPIPSLLEAFGIRLVRHFPTSPSTPC